VFRDNGEPTEVVTDLVPVLERAIEERLSDAFHNTERHTNNRVVCDHGRLEARLRPMCGLKRDRTARVILAGDAFMQNLRGPLRTRSGSTLGLRVAAALP
jgi:IS6 family transposase